MQIEKRISRINHKYFLRNYVGNIKISEMTQRIKYCFTITAEEIKRGGEEAGQTSLTSIMTLGLFFLLYEI